jgi:hypothetical protein
MFVLESSLMWSDRHVQRLAAFEAARVLAAANLPEYDRAGVAFNDPCKAPEALKRAKQAALRKIAIISPPLPLFLAKLGSFASGISLGLPPTDGSNAANAMVRLAKRWPTAVASTDMGCAYDANLGRITVTIKYHRMLQTPFIDRIIFIVYNLAQRNVPGPAELSLSENFFSLTASTASIPAVDKMRQSLRDSLKTVKALGLSMQDAANFMKDVPGVDSVFATVTQAPVDISSQLAGASSQGMLSLSTSGSASVLDQQSQLLTSLVAAVPEALRRIPITTQVSLQREVYSPRAVTTDPNVKVKEAPWDGSIRAVMNLQGEFRQWGHALSTEQSNLNDGITRLEDL